jgi:hypothetical protein
MMGQEWCCLVWQVYSRASYFLIFVVLPGAFAFEVTRRVIPALIGPMRSGLGEAEYHRPSLHLRPYSVMAMRRTKILVNVLMRITASLVGRELVSRAHAGRFCHFHRHGEESVIMRPFQRCFELFNIAQCSECCRCHELSIGYFRELVVYLVLYRCWAAFIQGVFGNAL